LGGPAQYLHWGFILISAANLEVIGLLVVVFMLAVLLRRPGEPHLSTLENTPDASSTDEEALP